MYSTKITKVWNLEAKESIHAVNFQFVDQLLIDVVLDERQTVTDDASVHLATSVLFGPGDEHVDKTRPADDWQSLQRLYSC